MWWCRSRGAMARSLAFPSLQARIYSPARTASQSGLARTLHNSAPAPAWKIAFETTGK